MILYYKKRDVDEQFCSKSFAESIRLGKNGLAGFRTIRLQIFSNDRIGANTSGRPDLRQDNLKKSDCLSLSSSCAAFGCESLSISEVTEPIMPQPLSKYIFNFILVLFSISNMCAYCFLVLCSVQSVSSGFRSYNILYI